MGHDEKVPVAVVDGPVGHGLVAGEHVDRYPVPGLAVSRSCSDKDDILSPLNLISPETRDEVGDSRQERGAYLMSGGIGNSLPT